MNNSHKTELYSIGFKANGSRGFSQFNLCHFRKPKMSLLFLSFGVSLTIGKEQYWCFTNFRKTNNLYFLEIKNI